jgi:Ni/Co efflux regulator RcnB
MMKSLNLDRFCKIKAGRLAQKNGGLMKRLRMLLIASALMAGGTALASAQPRDHDDRGRDRDDRARYTHRFDRDDRRFRDRDDHVYVVGQRRFINGYYWTWDGARWCRRDGGVTFYFGF